jgi:hypothetical protein
MFWKVSLLALVAVLAFWAGTEIGDQPAPAADTLEISQRNP